MDGKVNLFLARSFRSFLILVSIAVLFALFSGNIVLVLISFAGFYLCIGIVILGILIVDDAIGRKNNVSSFNDALYMVIFCPAAFVLIITMLCIAWFSSFPGKDYKRNSGLPGADLKSGI